MSLDYKFTYDKLAIASLYIQNGAHFIATNDDPYDNINGRKMPGTRAMIDSLKCTLKASGREGKSIKPVVLGKPNPFVIDLIRKCHDIGDDKR